MSKIGILGGTFNPIHNGHLLLAEAAREQYELDKVLFIPTGVSYLKANIDIPDGSTRLKMVQLAIEDNPYFEPSDMEIIRSGNTYTYETLLALKKEYPNSTLYFIMGADNVFGIESWQMPQVIFDLATILATYREGFVSDKFEEKKKELITNYKANIESLYIPQFDVSSTQIRERIKDGKSVKYLIPDIVSDYIYQFNLYKE